LNLEYRIINRATDDENSSETFTDVGKIGFGISSQIIFLKNVCFFIGIAYLK
jgi:hypothetical protein